MKTASLSFSGEEEEREREGRGGGTVCVGLKVYLFLPAGSSVRLVSEC